MTCKAHTLVRSVCRPIRRFTGSMCSNVNLALHFTKTMPSGQSCEDIRRILVTRAAADSIFDNMYPYQIISFVLTG